MSLQAKNLYIYYVLIYLSLSNPLYSINKSLFFMITCISIIVSVHLLKRWGFKEYYIGDLYAIFEVLYGKFVYVIIWLLTILVLANILNGTSFNNSISVVVILCWGIAYLIIHYVSTSIYFILNKTKEIIYDVNKSRRKYLVVTLFIIILCFIFIVPDVAFGLVYNLFFTVFANTNLGWLESIHLSMVVGNTLPVGNVIIDYVTIIESNKYIYTIQFVHIILNKLINFFVVGIILNYLLVIFKFNNKTES